MKGRFPIECYHHKWWTAERELTRQGRAASSFNAAEVVADEDKEEDHVR